MPSPAPRCGPKASNSATARATAWATSWPARRPAEHQQDHPRGHHGNGAGHDHLDRAWPVPTGTVGRADREPGAQRGRADHRVRRVPRLRDPSLEESIVDLGVLLKNNKFYPKGAEELDTALILQPLDWLSTQPIARQYFEDALSDYLKRDFPDAVTKAYSSLEVWSRLTLTTTKPLQTTIQHCLSY